MLKSWAVPKGPSLDPKVKSLAVHVEDHPLAYTDFEGSIPEGQYGGGSVMLWDKGTWEADGDAEESYRDGKLLFTLHGERLNGRWALIRMSGKGGGDGKNWLLRKIDDDMASASKNVLDSNTKSVSTGRTMREIAEGKRPTARGRRRAKSKPSSSRADD